MLFRVGLPFRTTSRVKLGFRGLPVAAYIEYSGGGHPFPQRVRVRTVLRCKRGCFPWALGFAVTVYILHSR